MISHEEPMQRVRRTPSEAGPERERRAETGRQQAGPREGGGDFCGGAAKSESEPSSRKREASKSDKTWGEVEAAGASVFYVLCCLCPTGPWALRLSVWVSYFMGWRDCMANGNNAKKRNSFHTKKRENEHSA